MTPSSGQDAGLYRRVCNKSPIFSQRLYRGVFSRPNLGKMVSDGGGGPSNQSSGLPIDRASHESSRSRARTRSSPLKHGWYRLLEHLTFHPCRRFRRTAWCHTFFVLDRMEDELLMIEQACRLPARCALLVPADSPSMGPSGRRASVSSWRDAFGDKVSCAKLLAQLSTVPTIAGTSIEFGQRPTSTTTTGGQTSVWR